MRAKMRLIYKIKSNKLFYLTIFSIVGFTLVSFLFWLVGMDTTYHGDSLFLWEALPAIALLLLSFLILYASLLVLILNFKGKNSKGLSSLRLVFTSLVVLLSFITVGFNLAYNKAFRDILLTSEYAAEMAYYWHRELLGTESFGRSILAQATAYYYHKYYSETGQVPTSVKAIYDSGLGKRLNKSGGYDLYGVNNARSILHAFSGKAKVLAENGNSSNLVTETAAIDRHKQHPDNGKIIVYEPVLNDYIQIEEEEVEKLYHYHIDHDSYHEKYPMFIIAKAQCEYSGSEKFIGIKAAADDSAAVIVALREAKDGVNYDFTRDTWLERSDYKYRLDCQSWPDKPTSVKAVD